MDFGIGVKLHTSELQTIHAIGENPEINVTELAKKLNITKGAASQMINKLVTKKMVAKFKGCNDKEIKIRLSDLGLLANKQHIEYYSRFFKKCQEYIDSLTDDQTEKILDLLNLIDSQFDEVISNVLDDKAKSGLNQYNYYHNISKKEI